jgi:cyclopropane fatty-acyl-phospholipid synthase-like methyltransferase
LNVSEGHEFPGFKRHLRTVYGDCKAGQGAGLKAGNRVIDYGCGFGETLALWAEHFGVSGVGIDVRAYATTRAREKMTRLGFADQLEIVCGNAAEYPAEAYSFDAAACIGATFIWDGCRECIRTLKGVAKPGAKLIIGEVYWKSSTILAEFAATQHFLTEWQLLQITREEGYIFKSVIRSNQDDWDLYVSDDWYGLVEWLNENPDHPDRSEVLEHLHDSQEEYVRFGREHLGWATYVLSPVGERRELELP